MRKKSRLNFVLLMSLSLFITSMALTDAEGATKPAGTLTVVQSQMAEEGFLPDRNSGSAGPLWEPVYDYLLYSDRNNRQPIKPIPGVAERFEYSKDGKMLTFYLRKGIQFHEGYGELTAEDVKFSIEFNMREKSRNLRKVELSKTIDKMEVKDPYTLVLHLKKPEPMLWLLFCTADSVSLPVLCKKYIEKVGDEKANRVPVGSGPYRLVEQKVGDYAKFEAYDEHWLVVPEFKYMILRVVPEESTRAAMVKTGEADIAYEMEVSKLSEYKAAGLDTIITPDANISFFCFGGMFSPDDKRYDAKRHNKDPWVDIRVREAMNLAIDRKAIVKSIYQGNATQAPIFWTLPGWEKLDEIPYDLEKAKKLLTEAGYTKGFNFKIGVHKKSPELPLLAEILASSWEAIGLKGEINNFDYATWRSRNKKGNTEGWIFVVRMSDYPDWTARLASYEMPNASTPLWQSPEITEGASKVRKATDLDKRYAAYNELAKVYRSIYSHIPMFYTPKVHLTNPKTVGEWFTGRLLHPKNFIFARHAKPLNTPRLFTP